MVEYINQTNVKGLFPKRISNSNKSTYGRVLNIAGSKNYRGAAYLSSVAASKVGAGYVTLASINDVINLVASMAPEITFLTLIDNGEGVISYNNKIDNIDDYNVISLGCGLTVHKHTEQFLLNFLLSVSNEKKMVIDADAINIISKNDTNINLKNSVITPHPKELSRLLNIDVNEINSNREKYACIAAEKYGCVVVLKGSGTVVTNGERVYINTSGNSALAKAGTGDVLTGIISGLIAQGCKNFDAAILGVFLHGLSGDIASSELTEYCVLASDVIHYLPKAIKSILQE